MLNVRMRTGERTIAEILGGRGGERPMTTRLARCALVSAAYQKADVGHFCNPLWLVVAWGLETRLLAPGERLPDRFAPNRLYYDWDPDPRIQGARVYRRFAAVMLGRLTHNAIDEHILAAELAVPEICALTMRASEIVARHPFAPVPWIDARVKLACSDSGVFHKPPELAG